MKWVELARLQEKHVAVTRSIEMQACGTQKQKVMHGTSQSINYIYIGKDVHEL